MKARNWQKLLLSLKTDRQAGCGLLRYTSEGGSGMDGVSVREQMVERLTWVGCWPEDEGRWTAADLRREIGAALEELTARELLAVLWVVAALVVD